MIINLTDTHEAILVGLLVSALDQARREGRTGPWVDSVREIFDACESSPNQPAGRKVRPTGGEPFGTQVTFWSAHWGNQHALITRSPKPAGERGRFDVSQWQIAIKDGGMTHAGADSLTLGWHPDCQTPEPRH